MWNVEIREVWEVQDFPHYNLSCDSHATICCGMYRLVKCKRGVECERFYCIQIIQ